MELDEPLAPLGPDELTALPVFPLPRMVFFPGSLLPLHIFEPRYRDLMESCLSEGPRAMAIVQLAEGSEDAYDGNPAIHEIAGAGRIVEHRRLRDGRFDLVLEGLHRVRLHELPADGKSVRRARAELLEDRVPQAAAELLPRVLATASSVMALLRPRHPDLSFGIDEDTSPGLVADRIADRIVAEPEARQRLLETTDVKVRLALVSDALVGVLAELRSQGLGGPLH